MITILGRQYGTAKDFAQWFGIQPQTFRRWRREGLIPNGRKYGKARIWDVESIAKVFEGGKAGRKEIEACILANSK